MVKDVKIGPPAEESLSSQRARHWSLLISSIKSELHKSPVTKPAKKPVSKPKRKKNPGTTLTALDYQRQKRKGITLKREEALLSRLLDEGSLSRSEQSTYGQRLRRVRKCIYSPTPRHREVGIKRGRLTAEQRTRLELRESIDSVNGTAKGGK